MSIEPLETEFGRKRKINQSTCNKDFTCIKGFCPSFFSIETDDVKNIQTPSIDYELPNPVKKIDEEITNIILTGIGGTGVLTISAILGMAANIENKKSTTLDMTGLSQKGGAVWAYIKLYSDKKKPYSHKITPGMSDVLLACDQVVATKDEIQEVLSNKRTYAVLNTNSAPVADFVSNTEIDFKSSEVKELIKNSTKNISVELDTIDLSYRFFGNTINANMIQLGAAFQAGLIPLKRESIVQAINLNKSGAENNIKAFNLGRLTVHDPKNSLFKQTENSIKSISVKDLKDILANYSKKSLKAFNQIELALNNAKKDLNKNIIEEVLIEYGRICLIKDEYRVASMHLKNYKKIINREFSSWNKISFYLAPPILSFIKDKKTGNPKKFKIPGYIALPLFYALDRVSFLRDTPLDIFKYSKERKHDYEHKRIFEKILNTALKNAKEVELKKLIDYSKKVKGYGSIKENNLAIFKKNILNKEINFVKI